MSVTDPSSAGEVARGWQVQDGAGRRIGTVDAAFADYLLVRTRGLLPVDLYVPRTAVTVGEAPETAVLAADSGDEAYRLWHRPLQRAPHP